MKKTIITIIAIIGILSISCKKNQHTCKCEIDIDGSSETFEQTYDNSSEAQEACNNKRDSYDNVQANFKSIECNVNSN